MISVDGVEGLSVGDLPGAGIADPGRVHGWFCDLDEEESGTAALSLLSPAEQARAATWRRERDRRRFVARCAFVRRVLGSLVRRPAETLVFRPGRCGKPYLAGGAERDGDDGRALTFSLSHSENILGLAVTFGREVGMDLEVVRPIEDPLAIAMTHFAPESVEVFRSRPAGDRVLAFYRLWTRNEAFAKMQGRGLECRHAHEQPTIARWALRSFTFTQHGSTIVGAFAVEEVSRAARRYRTGREYPLAVCAREDTSLPRIAFVPPGILRTVVRPT